jgi:hypothetical protein
MKDLTENIKEDLNFLKTPAELRILENQIAIMEALQDLQEKLMRIEGKMRNFK